ncbi:AEC family transporter [Parablautia sp. Marseille-Q6255]|uniref:AEC family transporter n=1 Tax=Parablautia sp. Marseille-Q6255 TaxID=3039593 RepID=UPI0024BD4C7E|nr:AEC family transporter [Parablautia sp. Marseille-Q6255]
MNAGIMLQLQITMFIILAVGIICTKIKVFTAIGRKTVTDIFIDIMIPSSIISAFRKSFSFETLEKGLWMAAAYTCTLTFCWLIGKVAYRNVEHSKQGILKYATIISNAQFMGFPIIQAIMGEEGLVLASMAMIPGSIFTWTVALGQFTKINRYEGLKNTLLHPCFCSVIIGICLGLFRVPLYSGIYAALEYLGSCVMPVSMLIIGSILSEVNLKSILDWKLYYFSIIRLLAIPLTMFFVFSIVKIDPSVRNTIVLMSAMPAGTVTAILAEKHEADAQFASCLIFISTLLSIITLPCLLIFLF